MEEDPTGMSDSPQDASPEELATTFIARQIQSDEPDAEYWTAMAAKVDAFLRRSYPERALPHGYVLDDLRQDVFVRLVGDMPSMEIHDRDRFWGFVKTLADRCAIDAARILKAQKRGGGKKPLDNQATVGDPLANAFDERAGTPTEHARAAEIEEHELACVDKLTRDESKQVYLLRRRELKSYDEIAEITGRRKAVTVRTIYARAQRDVTACLQARLDGYVSSVRS